MFTYTYSLQITGYQRPVVSLRLFRKEAKIPQRYCRVTDTKILTAELPYPLWCGSGNWIPGADKTGFNMIIYTQAADSVIFLCHFSPPPEKHLFVSYISEFSYFGHLWFDGWPSVCQCSYSCECQSLVTHGMCSHGITFLLLCQSMVLLCRAAYNMCVCVRMCACAGAWPSQCLYDSVLCQCVWERERLTEREKVQADKTC